MIIRASEYKHSWIKKAVADMKSGGSLTSNRREYEMGENDATKTRNQ